MQLMTRQEANRVTTQRQGNDVSRIALLEETLKKLQDRINQENTNFEQNLANQRKVYSEEKLTLQGQIKALHDQLEPLRAERQALMIPIETLKADAELLTQEANRRLIEITEREDEIRDIQDRLTAKLDEITDREQRSKDLETTVMLKKAGVDSEAEQVSAGHAKLNGQIKDFMEMIDTKQKELSLREETLNIEKKRVQEYLEMRTKELDDEKRGLADRRSALDREFNRLINK